MEKSKRLKNLENIFWNYKKDIRLLIRRAYRELGFEINDNVNKVLEAGNGFIEFSNSVNFKYAEVKMLENVLQELDKVYRDLMVIEELIKERLGGVNGE